MLFVFVIETVFYDFLNFVLLEINFFYCFDVLMSKIIFFKKITFIYF